MSEYYDDSFDDSFDSGSESEGGLIDQPDGPLPDTTASLQVPQDELSSSRSDTLLTLPEGFQIHRVKELTPAHAMSDPDDAPTSSVQDGTSPKPKKKFKNAFKKPKKPNIGQFTQRIKNKLRKDATVFGVTLETAVQRSQVALDGIELPTVFRECIDYLEELGTDHEGLYRLPGVKSKIEEAKGRYDKGEVVDLTDYDINTVASLLKLYLRELPDPLIPLRLAPRLEAISMKGPEEQYDALEELMEEVPPLNKQLLSWLLTHMGHIIDKSSVNKMTLPNMVIVFSPTLQISAPGLHTLYHNRLELFGAVELKKYIRPVVEKKDVGRVKLESHLSHVASLQTEEEVTAELKRLTDLLDTIHSKMTGKFKEKDDYLWELQRAITILRRKKKAIQAKTASSPKKPMMPPAPAAFGDHEFVKTLMLMEATLKAENEELTSKRDELKSRIRQEADLIDHYKRRLQSKRNRHSYIVELSYSDDDSDDNERDMAHQVAALKWHNKELELRNKNLIDSIQEEEKAIMDLTVKLKILPIRQQLNLDEGTAISY